MQPPALRTTFAPSSDPIGWRLLAQIVPSTALGPDAEPLFRLVQKSWARLEFEFELSSSERDQA